VLTSSEQAEMLLEQINREILGELLKQALSASQIARQTERPLKTVLYRLEKLLEVGLVEVVEQRKRGGRAVKIYGACSSGGWTFPFALTPAATVQELLEGQLSPLMGEMLGHLATQIQQELWLSLDLDDHCKVNFNLGPQDPVRQVEDMGKMSARIFDVRLTLEQAHNFNMRLRDFSSELDNFREDSSLPSYSVGLFFVSKSAEKA